MLIGYARISTDEQNLASQFDALMFVGCEKVFCDVGVSGATTERPELTRALLMLSPGDVLVVWKLDRLGRSLAHLIQLITQLEKRRVGFRSLSEAIDTTTASGRLLFHIMGAIAEFERSLIAERTRAGMAAARARGQHLGRTKKLSDGDAQWAMREIELGFLSTGDIASALNVSAATVRRAIKRLGNTAGQAQESVAVDRAPVDQTL
jgi:DNA invertase Pin-like site-specific DNA recombinase